MITAYKNQKRLIIVNTLNEKAKTFLFKIKIEIF
jgi:hypothetical protein